MAKKKAKKKTGARSARSRAAIKSVTVDRAQVGATVQAMITFDNATHVDAVAASAAAQQFVVTMRA